MCISVMCYLFDGIFAGHDGREVGSNDGFCFGVTEFELSMRPMEISSRLPLVQFGQGRNRAGDKYLFIHQVRDKRL